MGTGEQILEAIMTNVFVRVLEVLAAPIFIWFRASREKKEWPIGFIIIVLASSLFLEQQITGWIRDFTYDDQRVIRDWLDELKLSSTLSASKDDTFRFAVRGESAFEIYRTRALPGVVTFSSGIVVNLDVFEKLKRMPTAERNRLQSDIYLELSRHNFYLPLVKLKDGEVFNLMGMENDFEFPRGSSKSVLNEQLSKVTSMKQVVDFVFNSWIAQGKL